MHAISTIKLGILLLASSLLISVISMGASSHAQEMEENMEPTTEAASEESEETASTEEFDTYTVVEGDNLTELVRRSIVEHDNANEESQLTAAQIVYAETNIVQEMNCDGVLHIGQEVSVSKSKVASRVESASNLSEAEQEPWNVYAVNIATALPERTPTTTQTSNAGTGEGSGESEDVAVNSDTEDGGEETEESNENDEDNDDESSGTGWYWWVAGGAIIAGGWQVLSKGRE